MMSSARPGSGAFSTGVPGESSGFTRRTGVNGGDLERSQNSSSELMWTAARRSVLELHALGEAVVGYYIGSGEQASRRTRNKQHDTCHLLRCTHAPAGYLPQRVVIYFRHRPLDELPG